eukprot:9496488-Pyramimonas_sp.AAC.1
MRQLVGLPPDEGLPTLSEAHNAEHVIQVQHVDHLADVILAAPIGADEYGGAVVARRVELRHDRLHVR